MQKLNLFVNEVLKMDGQLYRVLWTSPDCQYGYWIYLGRQKRVPERFEYIQLTQAIQEGIAEVADDPIKVLDGEVSDSAKKKRDEWWNLLKPVLECEPDVYERQKRGEMLSNLSKKYNRDKANLYRYIQKYWRRGKTPNAFLQDYRNCGRGTKTQKGKKLGRPTVHEGGFGKSLTDNDYRHFEAAINKYYLNRSRASIAETYAKMLGDYYSVTVEDDDGKKEYRLLPEDQIPSITQLRYWYQKQRNHKKEAEKRRGEVKFELTGRAITGRSDYRLMGPGAKYQIDATVGDIYLVSQFDRKDIIGRPVIYFVVDSYSRIVAGMYVGLEGPSWAGAMMAIENAASDKVSYCAEYGITITEDEWPCHHVPTAILGDRGEMESRFADNLVKTLGVRIENAPPYRADLKGIIEQHFRTVNTNATPFLPGKVLPDMSERGGRDYRLDAKLDIRQFTQIIIRCVLYYNNSHYMDYYEKNEHMMQIGVNAIPIDLWNFGIRYCSGSLRSVPRDVLRQALMPSDKASITERGVRFKGLYYSSAEAKIGLWFEKARNKGTYKAKISYDPRDMGAILVEDPSTKEMIRCVLVDWESKYIGKQQEEVWYEQEKEKAIRKKHTLKEAEAKVNLGKQIESIVESAENMAKTDKRASKAERLRNIRGNRKNEREKMRKQESFMANESCDNEKKQAEIIEDEKLSPIMRMICEQVEEEVKDDVLYSQRTISKTDDSGISGESIN